MPVGRNDIPGCCNQIFFAGDTKTIKIKVPELQDLHEFDVEFDIVNSYGTTLHKDRSAGITTAGQFISIRFESIETTGLQGVYNYRVRLISPADEVNTVSWGNLTLS